MPKIVISAGGVSLPAELNESPTARRIWEALPVVGSANTWGDEIYFAIPITAGQEPDARAEVAVGELGYWPLGRAFCIFFGLTPASTDQRPRAYSPVNIVGRVLGDAILFRAVADGTRIEILRQE